MSCDCCFFLCRTDHGQMGLGKTLQAISLLSYLKIHSISPGPFCVYRTYPFGISLVSCCFLTVWVLTSLTLAMLAVVLCPLSVTDGWLSEFNKFCPSLRVIQYVGDKLHRRNLRRMMFQDVQKSSSSSHSTVCYLLPTSSFTYSYTLLKIADTNFFCMQ